MYVVFIYCPLTPEQEKIQKSLQLAAQCRIHFYHGRPHKCLHFCQIMMCFSNRVLRLLTQDWSVHFQRRKQNFHTVVYSSKRQLLTFIQTTSQNNNRFVKHIRLDSITAVERSKKHFKVFGSKLFQLVWKFRPIAQQKRKAESLKCMIMKHLKERLIWLLQKKFQMEKDCVIQWLHFQTICF